MSLADGSRTCQKYWISKGGLWSLSDASQWSKETRLPFSVVKEDTEAFRMHLSGQRSHSCRLSGQRRHGCHSTEAFRMPSQWSKETRLPFSVVKEDTEAFRMPSQWSKETQLPFSVVKEDTEAFRMPSQWSKETRKPFYDTLGLSYALLKNSA